MGVRSLVYALLGISCCADGSAPHPSLMPNPCAESSPTVAGPYPPWASDDDADVDVDDGEEDQVGVEDDVDGEEAAGKNETRSFAREDQLDAVRIEVVLLCVAVVVRPCEPRPLRCGPSAPIGAPAVDIVARRSGEPARLAHEAEVDWVPSLSTRECYGALWPSEREQGIECRATEKRGGRRVLAHVATRGRRTKLRESFGRTVRRSTSMEARKESSVP